MRHPLVQAKPLIVERWVRVQPLMEALAEREKELVQWAKKASPQSQEAVTARIDEVRGWMSQVILQAEDR